MSLHEFLLYAQVIILLIFSYADWWCSCDLSYHLFNTSLLQVTRLIPDSAGTSCNQRLERITGCEHSHILRVPFKTEHGVLRKWISRFDVWPYLEKFAEVTLTNGYRVQSCDLFSIIEISEIFSSLQKVYAANISARYKIIKMHFNEHADILIIVTGEQYHC